MSPYEELKERLREAATLESVGALLGWDQETMMPDGAAGFRAEELSLISRLVHDRRTDPRIGELIEACRADADLAGDEVEAANLRELQRDFDRATRLPSDLVAEMSETSSRSLQAWKAARSDSDFETFRPWLEKQFRLARRKAECYGAPEGGELYDALLEDYEPGIDAKKIEALFGPLREGLIPLLEQVRTSGTPTGRSSGEVEVPIDAQQQLNVWVAQQIGYDTETGRLDVSTHPFTQGLGPGDTRITTRYREDRFADALSTTLHEAGHALYEQGLPKAERHGEPLSQPVGLGVHESQSRMWENQVGRSAEFWQWLTPHARRILDLGVDELDADRLFRSVNRVQPGFIRVEADEVTYNLHVMLRFDLERAMLRGELKVAEIPGAWNERIESDLGLVVPDDRRGCLQDIHWAMGGIGYFPTYTLGNLHAAQYWEVILREMPDLPRRIARGRFGDLLDWLREKIHRHGRRFDSGELCRRISGRELEPQPLLRYLGRKVDAIYPTQ